MKREGMWVRWVDSSSRQGWHAENEIVQLMTAESLGWVIHEDEDQIVLALSGVFDGSSSHPWGHAISIPQRAVLARRKLKALP